MSKFSSEQKNLKSKKEDKSENIDNIDMEIDSEYKESPKNSIDLNFKDESHIEESKLRNNSYKNCDLSFGDNYSTAN